MFSGVQQRHRKSDLLIITVLKIINFGAPEDDLRLIYSHLQHRPGLAAPPALSPCLLPSPLRAGRT